MNSSMQLSLPLVLASQSPRRRELMAEAGWKFEVCCPTAAAEPDDERPAADESISQFVQRLARQKALDVAERIEYPALVIGCDTVADVDGMLLGKPKDRLDAKRMLQLLSGRQHRVWSGLCVVNSNSKQLRSDVAQSVLEMTHLDSTALDGYLDSLAWQGKSGAFGYQDGHPWLKLVSGTSDNVVGLPVELLKQLLNGLA